MELQRKQQLQEDEYVFPYHYLRLTAPHRKIPYYEKIRLITRQILKIKPNSFADVGCGDAYLIYSLKSKLRNITGYDYSSKSIGFAKAFNPNVSFKVADITKSPLGEEYDVISCIDILEHIEPKQLPNVLVNIHSSLAPKGRFLITVPSTNVSVPKKHFQHFSKKSMNEVLKNYFDIKHTYGISKKSWLPNVVYNFLLFASNTAFPFKFSKLKGVYSFFLSLTKKFYSSFIAESDIRRAKVLLFVCEKKSPLRED